MTDLRSMTPEGLTAWCKDHGLKPTDSITVQDFIRMTKYAYGGSIIRMLAEAYHVTL